MLTLGLGDPVDLTLPETATATETQAVIAALNAHNDRVFKVTLISTIVVGLAAALNTLRTFRTLQREEAREMALLKRLKK
jgi:hypothetical protein